MAPYSRARVSAGPPQPQPMSRTDRPGRSKQSLAAMWRFFAACASSRVSVPLAKIRAGILPVPIQEQAVQASVQVIVVRHIAPGVAGPR